MNNTPASSASPGLDAIHALLNHDHTLLNIRELGKLSISSREMASIFDQAGVWKQIFESTALAGREMTHVPSNTHARRTWNGEPGLLECFSTPDEGVIGRVGYKKAAGCLRSKVCHVCYKMAADANPLTMARVCKPCAAGDEGSFIISKYKAKEAFLLGEKDVKELPSASFASHTPVSGKECTSVVLLVSDVKVAAFAKYDNANGLAAEFAKRTNAAVQRYTKSQSTDKPQKKRPKIEKMSWRPADDVSQIAAWTGPSLPIGTAFFNEYSGDDKVVKMAHSAKCNICDSMGLVNDLVMHERLEQ